MAMTGLCTVKLNGQRTRSKGATLKPGGPVGEAVADDNGFCGVATKEHKGAEVKFQIPHSDDVDVTSLQQLKGVTLNFDTDSGQSYLINNAGTVGEVEIKGNLVDITMVGEPARLI